MINVIDLLLLFPRQIVDMGSMNLILSQKTTIKRAKYFVTFVIVSKRRILQPSRGGCVTPFMLILEVTGVFF